MKKNKKQYAIIDKEVKGVEFVQEREIDTGIFYTIIIPISVYKYKKNELWHEITLTEIFDCKSTADSVLETRNRLDKLEREKEIKHKGAFYKITNDCIKAHKGLSLGTVSGTPYQEEKKSLWKRIIGK